MINAPVLDFGDSGEWDDGAVYKPRVIKDGDTLRMWYSASDGDYMSGHFQIGYAWSLDGIEWQRYPGNPVLSFGQSWEAQQVGVGAVLKEENTYKMWYNAGGAEGLGILVGYATSDDGLHWTKHPEPVLRRGEAGDWDSGYIEASSVLKIDDEYKMWYWAAGGKQYIAYEPHLIGLATSIDGINWTKYDDPYTTVFPFKGSDPVLTPSAPGTWDAQRAWSPTVLPIDGGFEMWYAGTNTSISMTDRPGYTVSTDGNNWVKWPTNPISFPIISWGGSFSASSVLRIENDYQMWFANFGHNPRIGYLTSKSTLPPLMLCTNLQIDDSQGNQNHFADSGETVDLVVSLTNLGMDIQGVTATLSCETNADIQIIQAEAEFGEISRYETVSNTNTPFTITVNSLPEAQHCTFYLQISGENGYSQIDSFQVGVGCPKILLVDDAGDAPYRPHYTRHICPVVWNVSQSGCPPLEELKNYSSVVWFTGIEREHTLTPDEQSVLAGYLESGGKLLLTGQNIGFDLVENGSIEDSLFFANYLHAQFNSENLNANFVRGERRIEMVRDFTTLQFFGDFGGAFNQSSPDIIEPIEPAETLFKYFPGAKGAALCYKNEDNGSRLVYLAFSFEAINGPKESTAGDLIEKILEWLAESATNAVKDLEKANIPINCQLEQNFPNPFNPTTTIRFALAEAAQVKLAIYDLLGREIQVLVNEQKSAGIYEIPFKAADLSSGIYYYKISIQNLQNSQMQKYENIKKMILLK